MLFPLPGIPKTTENLTLVSYGRFKCLFSEVDFTSFMNRFWYCFNITCLFVVEAAVSAP